MPMQDEVKKPRVQLPKDALSRIVLGHAFAEYDPVLNKPGVYVKTPAIEAALDPTRSKCFFVGRRGTGKTAITLHLTHKTAQCIPIHPKMFVPTSVAVEIRTLADTRQRPFRSLVSSFERAIVLEALSEWGRRKLISLTDLPSPLSRDRQLVEDCDFDQRQLRIQTDIFDSLNSGNEKEWLRQIGRGKEATKSVEQLALKKGLGATILIDRIDESWDGSDKAVAFLMGLMHACVELGSLNKSVRVLLFLRENIFERVRQIDNEFARLETSVVSLDWTSEMLLELVERRLQEPFSSKPALKGETWGFFFEGPEAWSLVSNFCQERPRDVLTYCSFAIESAQSRRHGKVTIEDLQDARRRFSESRLKDLGDEYSENYPHIDQVLSRFYGLGNEYTVGAITMFIQKLLVDDQVKELCKRWIYSHTAPEQLIELLYNIGFAGLREGDGVLFRSLGVKSPTPPPISQQSRLVIHPSYVDALGLQKLVIGSLGEEVQLKSEGLIYDLPEATTLADYQAKLATIIENIRTLPKDHAHAGEWENIIGDTIRLCFFRSLANVEPKVRDGSGTTVKDWVTANIATSGFWELVRIRYNAVQVVWECKNYGSLKSDDFQQANYYMSPAGGRFVIIVFRGEVKKHDYDHIKKCSGENGLILLLNENDIVIFLRQALNGKIKESHIRDNFDRTIREIS